MEVAWVGLKIEWDRVSRNHQGRMTTVSQVDGDSEIAASCVYTLSGGRAQQRISGLH